MGCFVVSKKRVNLTNKNMSDKKDITENIIEAIQDKKGHGISVLDMSHIGTAPAREFIVCEGNNPTQVTAIADNIREELLEKAHRKPVHYTGYRNSQWIIIDYGDAMVHVFLPEFRALYNLEELWSDAKIRRIADLD